MVSITEVSSISLESSSSYEVKWKIYKDDKDETKIQWKKNEMEHNEVKENIFRQSE